jgi:carboxypeptidase Q
MGFNGVGEIPGTSKKDEIVMLGGHLDSWQGGTGATDNGTGSSVAMEATRILTVLHKPMDCTVRIALWGGEEEGLLGSKFYVQQHFAPRDTMKQTPEFAKLEAYFNDDSDSGRFRGISANGNLLTKAIFEQWIAPVKDLEITAVIGATAPPTPEPSGTDSTSFSWIGLNGYGFMQIRWSTPAEPTTPIWISTTVFKWRCYAGRSPRGVVRLQHRDTSGDAASQPEAHSDRQIALAE